MRHVAALMLLAVAATASAMPATHATTSGGGARHGGTDQCSFWMQYPGPFGMIVCAQYDSVYPFYAECADDFMYPQFVAPVDGVEWWGNYWQGSPRPPDAFIIRFYGDVPGPPFSHPGNLLYEESYQDYTEEYDPQYNLYRYYIRLAPGSTFAGEPDTIYWISIQAVLVYYPQWGWAACDEMYWWNDEGVLDFELLGIPRWTPLTQAGMDYAEFAFVLYEQAISVEAESWTGIKAMFR